MINSVHGQRRFGYNLSTLLDMTSAILLYSRVGNKKQGGVPMKRKIRIDDSDFFELDQDSARKVVFLDIDGVLNQDNGGPKI